MIEGELMILLSRDRESFADMRRMRSQAERKDYLNTLVRTALLSSSIGYYGNDLYAFDGRVYRVCRVSDVKDAIVNVLLDLGVGASDVGRLGDTSLSVLRTKTFVPNRNLVAFSNIVLDIDSRIGVDFSPELMSVFSLPYDFTMTDCPMWKAFLADILPDEGERMVLQEFFGMCFIDRERMSIEKMALLVGSGSNGKSVVCDVVKAVLGGREHVGNLSPDQLQDARQVVSLSSRVLNIAPDVRRGAAFDSALKALASSQEVTGWRLYEGGVTVKCPPLAFALNEMPYFRDTTPAFFRRLLVFPFDVTIPECRQDRTLASRLVAYEASGIFRWIIEGRERLIANGGAFTPCAVMDKALSSLSRDVRTSQSKVLQTIENMGYGVSGTNEAFVLADSVAEKAGVSRWSATHELRAAGVEVVRRADGIFYKLYTI